MLLRLISKSTGYELMPLQLLFFIFNLLTYLLYLMSQQMCLVHSQAHPQRLRLPFLAPICIAPLLHLNYRKVNFL